MLAWFTALTLCAAKRHRLNCSFKGTERIDGAGPPPWVIRALRVDAPGQRSEIEQRF